MVQVWGEASPYLTILVKLCELASHLAHPLRQRVHSQGHPRAIQGTVFGKQQQVILYLEA